MRRQILKKPYIHKLYLSLFYIKLIYIGFTTIWIFFFISCLKIVSTAFSVTTSKKKALKHNAANGLTGSNHFLFRLLPVTTYRNKNTIFANSTQNVHYQQIRFLQKNFQKVLPEQKTLRGKRPQKNVSDRFFLEYPR